MARVQWHSAFTAAMQIELYAGYYCQKYKTLDVTLTIIVSRSHFNLLKWLKRNDIAYSKRHEGIYDLYTSPLPISVQLVITEELDKGEFKWLASLTDKITKEQATDIVTAYDNFTDTTYRQLAEAVVRVISNSNEEVFEEISKEDSELDALTRILAPEIEKRVNESVNSSVKNYASEIVGRMIKNGLDNSIIVKCTNMPENEIEAMRSSMTV